MNFESIVPSEDRSYFLGTGLYQGMFDAVEWLFQKRSYPRHIEEMWEMALEALHEGRLVASWKTFAPGGIRRVLQRHAVTYSSLMDEAAHAPLVMDAIVYYVFKDLLRRDDN